MGGIETKWVYTVALANMIALSAIAYDTVNRPVKAEEPVAVDAREGVRPYEPEAPEYIDISGALAPDFDPLADDLMSEAPALPDVQMMRVTCYAPTGNATASGVMPFEGGCAAKREWMGGVAVVYDLNMNYIGHFAINDTGGHSRIKSGQSIDIYRDSLARCYEWINQYGDYMYVQIITQEE